MQRSVGVVSLRKRAADRLEANPETPVDHDSNSNASESSESASSSCTSSASSVISSPRTPCPLPVKRPSLLKLGRSSYNYEALTRSASGKDMEVVERCEIQRPASYRAIVTLQLSFVIDLPLHMIQPAQASPQKENMPARRRQSIRRTPSRVKKAFKSTRSYDVEEAAAGIEDPCLRLCRLRAMIEHLRTGDHLKTKGLFRLSGSAIRIRELTHRLGSDEGDGALGVDESRFTVHDVASALKAELASVAPLLIPVDHYRLYAQVVHLTDLRQNEEGVAIPFEEGDLELIRTKQLKAFRLLIMLLDMRPRAFLRYLCDCLKLVAQNADTTCLSENALGILFGPILFSGEQSPESVMIYNQVVELLLSWYPAVFEAPAAILEPMRKALLSPDGDVEHAASVCYVQRRAQTNTPTTAYALSELYAHIASMPDSAKKRRFIRQVSNKNGGIVSPNSPSVAHVERANALARQQFCL